MTSLPGQFPSDPAEDIDTYADELRKFLAGGITPTVFKARRVPRGVYEQRKDGSFMLRVRVSAGVLNAAQIRELADLGSRYGNGLLHATTRQDVQLHDLRIEDTPAIMRRLLGVGLSSKGGGGNTVRNVTACPYAGICPAEKFDVTPYALSVARYLVGLPGSYNLPRKYKISFSGCGADCALAQVADLGFIAEMRDGLPGFRVLAGGGMGTQARVADLLADWLPARDVIRVAEAMRRVFDRYGERRNRRRARLRFVFERLGVEKLREIFLEQTKASYWAAIPDPSAAPPDRSAPAGPPVMPVPSHDGLRVIRQRQAGWFAVLLHLPLGFLPAADFARLGEIAERYSRAAGLRVTRSQNLLMRFVKIGDLPALAEELRALATDVVTPVPLDRFVPCAGAATCRLGICLARNAAQACAAALEQGGVARATLDAMGFHINGCSNACGHQPVGAVGFFGAAGRTGNRLFPAYGITLGGRCGAQGARFGTLVGKIPAQALPEFTRELALNFQEARAADESFTEYFDRVGAVIFSALAARHAAAAEYARQPGFYQDLGAQEEFSLAGRGPGECGAGVFEVIQEDLQAAKNAAAPFDILLPTLRALLITRGVDAAQPDAVIREFERHFIDRGLIAEHYRPLLARARAHVAGETAALEGMADAIIRLRGDVEQLYATLDADLAFHPPGAPAPGQIAAPAPARAEPQPEADLPAVELDLSGVACPMNFVKAKLKLEQMDAGAFLAIILDEGDPINNVPRSFADEGQAVGEPVKLENGQWRVTVRKQG